MYRRKKKYMQFYLWIPAKIIVIFVFLKPFNREIKLRQREKNFFNWTKDIPDKAFRAKSFLIPLVKKEKITRWLREMERRISPDGFRRWTIP